MEQIINYLDLKNKYLEKFYSVSKKFLESHIDTKWLEIEFFVDNRERILNIIHYFDQKVASLFKAPEVWGKDLSAYRPRVKELFAEREKLAKKIVDLDLALISAIDEMKSETITELKKTINKKIQLNSFSAAVQPPTLRKPVKSA